MAWLGAKIRIEQLTYSNPRTMTNTNRPYSPSPEYRYFLYDPNDGHTFYRTPEEREIAAKSLIKDYLVDGEWSEQVVDIYAGEATHSVSEVERIDKVGELDEDGYDENGEYWVDDDVDCKCNYDLCPLVPTPPAEGELAEPSDEELLRTYGAATRNYCYEGDVDDWPRKAARAATVAGLRAILAHWGRPVPPPADQFPVATKMPLPSAEVEDLATSLQNCGTWLIEIGYASEQVNTRDMGIKVARAAALLQQQAAELAMLRQRVAPVPVSERLPDTSDPSECRMPFGDFWWFDPYQDGAWYMDTYQSRYTHWLPAHVLPLPSCEAINA